MDQFFRYKHTVAIGNRSLDSWSVEGCECTGNHDSQPEEQNQLQKTNEHESLNKTAFRPFRDNSGILYEKKSQYEK